MKSKDSLGRQFERLVEILDVLRGENGCPWDKQQTELSLINYFLEEVYEAVDAVLDGKTSSVCEELGDVMMELVFLARIYKEQGIFTMEEVLEGINGKMIRRHPHVFGQSEVSGAEEVLDAWHKQKETEKKRESLLDGVSKAAPSLLAAFELGKRASSQGFDWSSAREAFSKVKEEVAELESALDRQEESEMTGELGDLLFALCNVSRHLGINPELALRRANGMFSERFRYIEDRLKEKGKAPSDTSLEEMDRLWDEAKDRI